MGVATRILRTALNTADPGGQHFLVSGMGTPKAAIFIVTEATANDTSKPHAMISVGFADDALRQFSVGNCSQDNVADSNCSHVSSNTSAVSILEPTTGAILEQLTVDYFEADGVHVTFSFGTPKQLLVTVIFFLGSDLSVYAGDWTASASVDTETDVTAPGFQPDNLIVIASQNGTYNSVDDLVAQCMMSFGLVNYDGAAIVQASSNWTQVDAGATSDGADRVSTIYAASDPDASPAIEITQVHSTGFKATTRGAGGAFKYMYLAMKYNNAVKHWVGTITTPSATGNKSETGPGFKPQCIVHGVTASVAVDVLEGTISVGAGTFGVCAFTATELYTSSVGDRDLVTTMDTESHSRDALSCRRGDQFNMAVANFVSFDPTGWTVNYNIANLLGRKLITLAIEEFVPPRVTPAVFPESVDGPMEAVAY